MNSIGGLSVALRVERVGDEDASEGAHSCVCSTEERQVRDGGEDGGKGRG
jgi:hypothetical protein